MKAIVYKDELGTEQDEIEIPENLAEAAAAAREHLLEEVSHYDDDLLELLLEEAEVPEAALKEAIRKATLSTKLTPVLCGSSFKNKGVQPLLDAVIDYLPSPLDVPPVVGHRADQGRGGRSARSSATPTTQSRSPRSPSRSPPTPTSASSPTSASTPAIWRPARAC